MSPAKVAKIAAAFERARNKERSKGRDVKPTKRNVERLVRGANSGLSLKALDLLFEQGKLKETGAKSGGSKYAWND